MPFIPRLEIDVAFQVVGKEAQAELKCYQAGRVKQVVLVCCREKAPRLAEISSHNGPSEVGLKADCFPLFDFLAQGIAC